MYPALLYHGKGAFVIIWVSLSLKIKIIVFFRHSGNLFQDFFHRIESR